MQYLLLKIQLKRAFILRLTNPKDFVTEIKFDKKNNLH